MEPQNLTYQPRCGRPPPSNELPDDFQRAEFLLAHGMLDAIVPRHQMRFTLARILAMLTKPRGNRGAGQGAGKGKRKGMS